MPSGNQDDGRDIIDEQTVGIIIYSSVYVINNRPILLACDIIVRRDVI